MAFRQVHGFGFLRDEFRRAVDEARPLALGQELRRDEDATLQNEVDRGREHVRVERLRDETRGAQLQHAHDALLVDKARDDEDLEHRLDAHDFFHEFGAGDAGHREVEDEQVGAVALARDEVDRVGGAPRREDFGRGITVEQHHREGTGDERMVVDDQVLHGLTGPRPCVLRFGKV